MLKFISSLGNEASGKLNWKIIESMFRVPLMLKIWNDSIEQVNVKNKNFLTNLKQEKIKNWNNWWRIWIHISNYFRLFSYKIILPNFERRDIIYLLFQYNENNRFTISINE